MVNAKRLYVYGVMGVALVPLLWGLTSILRSAVRAAAAAAGDRSAVGADGALDELSLAIALVVVALPIWAVHAWLAQRPLAGRSAPAMDERGSPARATYFFFVLTVAGGVALLQLYSTVQEVLRVSLTDDRAWGLAGAAAALVVSTAAWLGHLWWRRADMLAAPARTAGDWLTRTYVYGGLFLLAVLLAFWIGNAVAVVAGELIEARPAWDRWQDAFVGPAAGVVGAAVGWSAQWSIARWLVRADPPMGDTHRASRTRTGYFLAVVLVSAAAVLSLVSSSLSQVLAEMLGVWRPVDASRWIEAVMPPLIFAAPFVVAWWWHWRQAMREAHAFGGRDHGASVRRSGLYVLAFVGLGGLAIGMAWAIESLVEYVDATRDVERSDVLRIDGAPALATCFASLALWIPAWRLVARDFAGAPAEVAASVPRRAYLLLVSGLAVIALMGSLALLVYHLIRVLLDVDTDTTSGWPLAVTMVAGIVLAYHLWRLRLDGLHATVLPAAVVAATDEPGLPARVVETVEISAPAGHDLETLNDAISGQLPEGVEMRVVRAPSDQPSGPPIP